MGESATQTCYPLRCLVAGKRLIKAKDPVFTGPFKIAGAGFEPATFGL
jgi:hypothetical protein